MLLLLNARCLSIRRLHIFVHIISEPHNMACLEDSNKRFKKAPSVTEYTGVTFNKNRPSGSMREQQQNFSLKKNLYGYSVEVAVRPNRLVFESLYRVCIRRCHNDEAH